MSAIQLVSILAAIAIAVIIVILASGNDTPALPRSLQYRAPVTMAITDLSGSEFVAMQHASVVYRTSVEVHKYSRRAARARIRAYIYNAHGFIDAPLRRIMDNAIELAERQMTPAINEDRAQS